jgi:hypothetical protein
MQVAQQALGEGPLARGLSDVLSGFMQPAGYSNRLNVSWRYLVTVWSADGALAGSSF